MLPSLMASLVSHLADGVSRMIESGANRLEAVEEERPSGREAEWETAGEVRPPASAIHRLCLTACRPRMPAQKNLNDARLVGCASRDGGTWRCVFRAQMPS